MPLIGLTGGLGTGKSLVSSMLAGLGAKLVDCDVLAREVTAPGSEGLVKVVETFGGEYMNADGTLDRRALGGLVFTDEAKRRRLENILHPMIERLIDERIAKIRSGDPGAVIVVDAALLFESGLYRRMDANVAVVCDPAVQAERAEDRDGLTRAEVHSRIRAQWPLGRKAEMADHVIDNSGTQEMTLDQVKQLWTALASGK